MYKRQPYGNLAIDEATAKTMGDTAVGMYLSASYLTSIDTPQNHKFLDGLKAKFGADAKTANAFSGPQYEAFFLYKAAVDKAGSTDSQDVYKRQAQCAFQPQLLRQGAEVVVAGDVQQVGGLEVGVLLHSVAQVVPGGDRGQAQAAVQFMAPVSYTHLDVYKRQA